MEPITPKKNPYSMYCAPANSVIHPYNAKGIVELTFGMFFER